MQFISKTNIYKYPRIFATVILQSKCASEEKTEKGMESDIEFEKKRRNIENLMLEERLLFNPNVAITFWNRRYKFHCIFFFCNSGNYQ